MSQRVDVIGSSQVGGTPSSRRRRRLTPPARRAGGVAPSLGALDKQPASVGRLSEAVLAVLGKHVPMPWAMLKAQCDRIGVDPSNVQASDLPGLADVLAKASARLLGPTHRAAMREALLALRE